MIKKKFTEANGRPIVRVTFTMPKSAESERIFLVGDFNSWNCKSHPFTPGNGTRWTLTLDLDLGRAYQFRYFKDGKEWMNDSQADAFVYNPHGYHNFVIITDPEFIPYRD